MSENVAEVVEAELMELSVRLTEPAERECLRCYLLRMMDQFGCDGTHRWTVRWRDCCAPRARGLVSRLARQGACCCDCEVILNVYPYYPDTSRLLPCVGVMRAGSSVPCDLTSLRRSA
ncbi:MAG: DUF2695 domain-containing protein [Actinomycetota bacterium]